MKVELYEQYRKVEATHWWFTVRRRIVKDIFRHIGVDNSSKILDVGCNYGYFVGELHRQGFKHAHGTDISREAIEYGQGLGIAQLSESRAETLAFPDNSFDVTLALDVIEHIEDDRVALNEIYRVTKPGGYAIIMVPAYMFLWSLQDEVAKHYRRYTKTTFTELVSRTAFSAVRMTYFNTFLFPMIYVIRKIERLTGTNRSSDFDLNNRFTNVLLAGIFGFESFFLRFLNFPFGVSLLVILKKP